jgi:8-oxo-dGTP pyrophosphatase MutT (NUDIX family)
VSFETTSGPPATPRPAASVILVRPRGGGPALEVFLLRRHKRASFMSSAFVFPGGVADPGEDDPRLTAARELFEEAGVLLSDRPIDGATREAWRAALHEGGALSPLLAAAGARLALDALHPVAHWITPSVEPRRYAARFYLAALPAGQEPRFDDRETVEQIWVTADEALARAGELRLPPPQLRTFADLAAACAAGWPALVAEAARRARHPEPILPRFAADPAGGFSLLLPWDPDYAAGPGETFPWPADHPLAGGPSRFVLEDGTWKNVAPPSTRAG